MMERGCVRLSGDHTEFIATGSTNPRQHEAILLSARAHEAELQFRAQE